jgi:hypothetical protein
MSCSKLFTTLSQTLLRQRTHLICPAAADGGAGDSKQGPLSIDLTGIRWVTLGVKLAAAR